MGSLGGADLRSRSPQPDTSSYCETTDTGLVHHVVCLFTSQPKLSSFYRPGSDGRRELDTLVDNWTIYVSNCLNTRISL